MKKKNLIVYSLMALPLAFVNCLTLATDYFEEKNISVNINICILFLFIGMIVTVTKLFFDFFVVVATAKATNTELESGHVLDLLISNMYIQWIGILVGFLVSKFLFDGNYIAEQVLFAFTHGVYYACISMKLFKKTNIKAFCYSFSAIVLVYWVYVTFNIIRFIQL